MPDNDAHTAPAQYPKSLGTADRLSLRTKLLFSTGDLSTSIPLAIVMFYQLYFLTDIARLPPHLAALAVGIGRLWDAVNDPLFGLISDRIRSRWGRRRVLLLFGAVPLGVSFAMMWLVPPWDPLALTLYYSVAFILFDTIFTAVHVSYNSLTPEMTPDYDERSSLNGYRMVFSIAGTLGAIILATVLGWYITDSQTRIAVVGICLGLASIVPPLIVFAVTREPPSDELPESMPALKALWATLTNRPFLLVMGLYLLSWTAASILAAALIYFANYYLQVPDQGNYFILVAQGSALLFIPLVVYLARRLDKRRAFILGSLSWIIVLLAISLIHPDQVTLAYLLAALGGFGIATAYVIPWSMIPDLIEYDEVSTGRRREGSYYSFASLFQKMATGVALWSMGLALAYAGYLTPPQSGPLPAQPPEALAAIRIFMGPVPALLLALAILCAWRYPIGRQQHQALRKELASRDA